MNTGPPPITTEAQARAMMAVLGKAEGEFVASLTVALFWVLRDSDRFSARNGSAFFLDAGKGPFGVTAQHVIQGWREDRARKNVVALQMAGIPFDPEGKNKIIAEHAGIDIATFRISPEEIKLTGKTVLKGYQSHWPPQPPLEGRGVYFAGFPGVEKLWLSQRDISFGIAPGGGVANSVSEDNVSSLIDREKIIPVLGDGIPPENYNFQGISGGPMLSVIEYKGLIRSWALAGVIYEGPNTSEKPGEAIPGLEIVRARRAHYIFPDGSLDTPRWERR
jgi:hypothetical protein